MTTPILYKMVSGYNGFYRVGDDGSVWSCRYANRLRDQRGPWVKLRQYPSIKKYPNGHRIVWLRKDAKAKGKLVHRLVLESFIGPCPEGWECRHYPDQDPRNNKLKNLSWASKSVNQRDRVERGTSNRKIPNSKVIQIIELHSKGMSHANISRRVGLSDRYVGKIIRKEIRCY